MSIPDLNKPILLWFTLSCILLGVERGMVVQINFGLSLVFFMVDLFFSFTTAKGWQAT